MKRDEYFLKALMAEAYRKAKWVFSVFTVVRDSEWNESIKPEYNYQVFPYKGKYISWIDNQYITIEDTDTSRPLYLVEEGITIPSQDYLVQTTDIPFPFRTRVGSLFLNYYCLVSAFKNKIPYQNGQFTISDLESIVIKKLVDYPDDPRKLSNDAVYPHEVKLFSSACSSVSGFSAIATPSATAYTMQPAPGIKEKRAELLNKYKDRLDDPVIVAQIEKELVAYDRAYQAQDPEGGFLQSKKAFEVSRKKLFVMGGIEMSDISDKKAFVEKSLSESWDINSLPAMIDSLRNGSYNRGALTALGGEAVKFIFRIFAATSITEEDCGSKTGIPRVFRNAKQAKIFLGNTAILQNGQQVKITEELIPTIINKPIMVRSPGFCKTGGANFCQACLGEQLRGNENALAAMASKVGSQMLDIFMAKMHGVALTTTPWNPEDTLS